MAINGTHVQLARSLPPRLLRFFAQYPPRALRPAEARNTASVPPSIEPASIENEAVSAQPTVQTRPYENPFRNTKHPVTGIWHDPVFSLRRQSELFKLARDHGVEELLPFSTKASPQRTKKREEHGLRVKGTGVGQRVKGHWRERTLMTRLDKRRQAMLEMPALIEKWKQLGHGRGWKTYPRKAS